MQAILVNKTGPADILECGEIDKPTPGPGQLLIKVAASGVSFGDVMMRQGQYPDMPPFPFIPGAEAAGEVMAVGEGVSSDWIGKRALMVLPSGCNAEYVAGPVIFAAQLPQAVTCEAAVALGVNYLTAHYVLHKAVNVNSGDTVVVYAAAGGVGSALIQLAKLAKLKVIGLAGSDSKCQFASSLGADHTICTAGNAVAKQVMEFTQESGAQAILNSVGGDSLREDLQMLGPFGQLVLYGMAAGPPTPEFLFEFLGCFNQSISLRLLGMHTIAANTPEDMGKVLKDLVDLTATGKLAPHIHSTLPLNEASQAHSLLESRQVMGKLVLTVT